MTIVVRSVAPEYPLQARQRRLEGRGILEAEVDLKTGRVTSAQMIQSTGHKILDNAALTAFRQWRFKPGIVQRFRTPINYEMAGSRADAMEKVRRLQSKDRQQTR
jgi:TonB family protein